MLELANLVAAVKNNKGVEGALEAAIEKLGYDPSIKDQEYSVSLELIRYAKTPEEAVENMIKELQGTLSSWIYKVVSEDGEVHFI